jgi:Skp family chaperone for outer membrane proteins
VKHKIAILALAAAAAAGAAFAQTPKVALVNLEQALVMTTDGQNAEKKLDARFIPRKAALDRKHKELMALQDKLDRGELSDEERGRLSREIEQKGDEADSETTQADADLAMAQRQVLRDLGPKLMAVVVRYAKAHGYDVVFDIGSSDIPRLYADNATEITKEVVEEYEKSARSAAPAKK